MAAFIVSGVPSRGRPYGWSPKTALYARRTIASRGLSVWMRVSSKMTSRSALISLGSNFERKAMSSSSPIAVLVASLGTRIWKVV